MMPQILMQTVKQSVIVIGDGDFTSGEAEALQIIRDLNAKQKGKVKTIAIAYGSGISPGGLQSFNQISINGGYPSGAIIASGPAALRARLGDIIRNIQADKLAFTAPAITATVEEGGNLQAHLNTDRKSGKEH